MDGYGEYMNPDFKIISATVELHNEPGDSITFECKKPELAPCGCGSKAERIRLGYQKAVACVKGCVYTGWCDTQEEADAKWNRSRGIKEDTCCH